MYDAIIVGARCAGSPLAMLLARRGARVLVVDRATFPSNIPHGHFIHRHGPKRLQRWGLLDEIAAASTPVTSMLTDFGDFPLVAHGLEVDGVAWGYGPRRAALDKILVDAAAGSGAEVREGFNVEEFLFEDGRMVGIRGRGANGAHVEEQATITVGADGRNSRLARAAGATAYRQTPPLLCYYFSYWSGVQSEDFELYTRPAQRRAVFSHRTSEGQFAVFVGLPADELPAMRADLESSFLRVLDGMDDLGERVRAGSREERFFGASDLPNFYRTPYGPGWALVGDAGMHKDPFLALGICDALRDAEYLAEAIGDGLEGTREMMDALARFQQRRDEASDADYAENLTAARLEPLPNQVYAMRAAIRHNTDATRRFMLARNGMIEPAEAFSPQEMQHLLAHARSGGAATPSGYTAATSNSHG
ncbi:MAG: NAD(P)/FAD-dependent oxidoreductase [Dehalococcoidia bacterium]